MCSAMVIIGLEHHPRSHRFLRLVRRINTDRVKLFLAGFQLELSRAIDSDVGIPHADPVNLQDVVTAISHLDLTRGQVIYAVGQRKREATRNEIPARRDIGLDDHDLGRIDNVVGIEGNRLAHRAHLSFRIKSDGEHRSFAGFEHVAFEHARGAAAARFHRFNFQRLTSAVAQGDVCAHLFLVADLSKVVFLGHRQLLSRSWSDSKDQQYNKGKTHDSAGVGFQFYGLCLCKIPV